MRIREGFVSNSSSCSFVVKKRFLTPYEIDAILSPKDYFEEICKYKYEHEIGYTDRLKGDPSLEEYIEEQRNYISYHDQRDVDIWSVRDRVSEIIFDCSLDNFDYLEYVEWIGVDKRALE